MSGPSVVKEVRALLPTWLACTVVTGAVALLHDRRLFVVGVLAYALGSVSLGAQSVGHEYTHRTLGLLLAQPVDRRRLLLTKVGVLAVLVLTLTLGAAYAFADVPFQRAWGISTPTVLLMTSLGALLVAPWLTLLCRGTLPGVIFTVALPGLLMLTGEALSLVRYGLIESQDVDRFRLEVFWWGTLATAIVAAVSAWRMFIGLETIDGRSPHISLPGWLRRQVLTEGEAEDFNARRKASPFWLLIKKELRLQQMTFTIVLLYVIGWASVALLERIVPGFPTIPMVPIAVLYLGLLSILIGSLASAEERHLGTLAWQMLLPMPMWMQWTVKVGVALGLAVALGVGLPLLLDRVSLSQETRPFGLYAAFSVAGIVGLLTTFSLYISSLCGSGVRAMVMSFPAIVAALIFARAGVWLGATMAQTAGLSRVDLLHGHPTRIVGLLVVLAAGAVALLLWLAFSNHRSAERDTTRVIRQAVFVAAFVTAGVALFTGL
jgi:ABC-type transport system involved in multi-copper enzyme maturation permease subunit